MILLNTNTLALYRSTTELQKPEIIIFSFSSGAFERETHAKDKKHTKK
jgi:hypothetical protein